MTGLSRPTYPIQLRVAELPVLVVGAGAVAFRKVERLCEAGALVTVVAPEVDSRLQKLASGGKINVESREYRAGEASTYRLVICATGRPEVEQQVVADAEQNGIFVNVADVPDLCSFYLPALVRRGKLQISIATDGAAPFAARRLRQRLEKQFGERWEQWLETAAEFRDAVLQASGDPELRDRLFDRFMNETLPADGPVVLPPRTWQRWLEEIR